MNFDISNSGDIGAIVSHYPPVPQYNEGDVFDIFGFAISGVYNDEIWSNGILNGRNRIIDYIPGKVNSNPENAKNKIYIVKRSDNDFGESWQDWKNAVELGANFYDGNNDGIYNPVDINNNGEWDIDEDMPDLLGDFTAWCVYNDGLPESKREFIGMTPKGIEVKQTVFLSALPDAGDLGNVFFVRYEIENTGTVAEEFDSVYFAFTIDADIGDNHNDVACCDTNFQYGITYNYDENEEPSEFDSHFLSKPPALIMYPLQSPHKYILGETFIDNNNNSLFDLGIDTSLDSTVIKRGPLIQRKIIEGSKHLDWNAFSPYHRWNSVFRDPLDEIELRNLMLGGRYINGEKFTVSDFMKGYTVFNDSLVDPNSINPKYVLSGDPVENSGWLYKYSSDFRMLISYGPFIFRKGDPQEVICAIIAGRGDDRLSSITEAKRIANIVKEVYDNNFADLPVEVKENKKEMIPAKFVLEQNYPNPFNPTTTIKYSIPQIYVGNEDLRSVHLKVFDVLGREVATLVNQKQKPGNYEVIFDGTNLPSGIYFYRFITPTFNSVRKMMLLK
jgi:hypothetical protein